MHAVTSKLALLGAAAILASVPAAARSAGWGRPAGGYFLVGAGVTQFTDSGLSDAFDTGVTWDARLGVGNRSFLGAEVAYVGAFRSAAVGENDLTAHGAEGVLRLQFPYTTSGDWLIEPFALGGIGWSHLSIDKAPPGATDSDDIGVVPVGGGLMVGRGRLLLDGRFTYRATFSEDAFGGDLETWAVVGSIGYQF